MSLVIVKDEKILGNQSNNCDCFLDYQNVSSGKIRKTNDLISDNFSGTENYFQERLFII
ncbi:MAG: hypothetical protein QNJ68_02585 [Microcoleaceae cyanobacterium MO_207.B10]|nr:hypothetical protein [Microcoleaceae cyanobacterium MO_207.B10]